MQTWLFALAWAGLAFVTRPQMAFLYVVAGVVLLLEFYSAPDWKRLSRRAAAAGLMMIVAVASDVGYRTVHHGVAAMVPFSGIQLATMAVYISDDVPQDFVRTPTGDLFSDIRSRAAERGLTLESNPLKDRLSLAGAHWASSSDDLKWGVIVPTFAAERFGLSWGQDDQGGMPVIRESGLFVEMDRELFAVSSAALRDRPARAIRHYATNLAYVFRNSNQYATQMAVIVLALAAVCARCGSASRLGWTIWIFLCMHLTNYLFIAVWQPLRPRYTFYTDQLVVVAVVLYLFRAPDENSSEDELSDHGSRPVK